MKDYIFQSSYGTVNRKWQDLRTHRWNDFALLMLEEESNLKAKNVLSELSSRLNFRADTYLQATNLLIEYIDKRLVLSETTEMNVAIFISVINFYEWLIYLFPWYDKINKTFQNNARAIDVAFRYLEEQIARVERNLNLDSAIEALEIWERMLDIKTNRNLSFEQRRRQIGIVNRLRFDQVNEENIKLLIRSFSNNNSEVEITRSDKDYVFDIKFVAGGLPNNADELDRQLRKFMPADEDWKFSYTQRPWENISQKKIVWGSAKAFSWKDFNNIDKIIA